MGEFQGWSQWVNEQGGDIVILLQSPTIDSDVFRAASFFCLATCSLPWNCSTVGSSARPYCLWPHAWWQKDFWSHPPCQGTCGVCSCADVWQGLFSVYYTITCFSWRDALVLDSIQEFLGEFLWPMLYKRSDELSGSRIFLVCLLYRSEFMLWLVKKNNVVCHYTHTGVSKNLGESWGLFFSISLSPLPSFLCFPFSFLCFPIPSFHVLSDVKVRCLYVCRSTGLALSRGSFYPL